MSRSTKKETELRVYSNGKVDQLKINQCHMCGKRFRSRSHFDALCDLCWADNEMKPYVSRTRGYRGTGFMN